MKGSKYLLLKNKENIREEEKLRLRTLLDLNEAITTVYILKGQSEENLALQIPKILQERASILVFHGQ
ncbi:TPA: hypothetical protein DD712_02490 [Candidatus Acetothermia bacterium]|nr:hypothetical protein [Candidatus Acetothermia bacterium]